MSNITTSVTTLTVGENSAKMLIGIAAPIDTNYSSSNLTITVASLPTDGTIYLPGGSKVYIGEKLSVKQLTGLLFKPKTGLFGTHSTFSYTVKDPSGTSVTGVAALAIAPDAMRPVTIAASLSVVENAAPTKIGIVAPTDPNYAASQLKVTVTGLPTDGAVLLSDGVTQVSSGETLTLSQLTGLMFKPITGVFGQTSAFTYSVTDPAGLSTAGTASLSVAKDATLPATTAASLTVAANSAPTPIGIAAPTDANFSASQLNITVTGLPTDGTVFLADKVTPVTAGETLSVSQLTGLTFAPTAGLSSGSSQFSYTVGDPAGLSAAGAATLAVGSTGADTLVVTVAGDYNPQFHVFLNDGSTVGSGTQIGGAYTATASNSLGQWQNITLTGNFSNAQNIDVEFFNDGTAPGGGDINLYVKSITLDGTTYLAANGEFNQYNSSGFVPGTGTEDLYWDGTLRFVVGNNLLTTAPASLSATAGGAPAPIGISAPVDANYAATSLSVMVTGLPADGTVYLSDGVTQIIGGEVLSVAQLTGLEFAGGAGAAGQTSTFTYTVSDPTGASANGSASLSVVANAGGTGPTTTAASLTVAENAGLTPIGISAPADSGYASTQLGIKILGMPTDGTVYLSDGTTKVAAGQSLTVAQLTGLEFAPTPGLAAISNQLTYSVTDPAGNAANGAATLAIAPTGRILTVGAGKEYSTIAAAIGASQNGDTIQVQAGTYTNDFATISDNITLEGVGGMVNMVCTEQIPNGKAILVTDGNDTINNFSFTGAQVAPSDDNGAGIRWEAGNLTLNDDYFFNNEEGLLGGPSGGTIIINYSEFANNGVSDPNAAGYGYTHNLYIGNAAQATINNSYFHNVNIGNQIKSRAQNTTVENTVIEDGSTGTGSYDIDLPNGGNALIQNNFIQKGPLAQNPAVITIGEEGVSNATSSLQVSGNTIVNQLSSSSSTGVRNDTSATVHIFGNQVYGLTASQIAAGPNTQANDVFLSTAPALITTHPWSA